MFGESDQHFSTLIPPVFTTDYSAACLSRSSSNQHDRRVSSVTPRRREVQTQTPSDVPLPRNIPTEVPTSLGDQVCATA